MLSPHRLVYKIIALRRGIFTLNSSSSQTGELFFVLFVSSLHWLSGDRGRCFLAPPISSKSSSFAGSLVTCVVITSLMSLFPTGNKSSILSLPDTMALRLAFRLLLLEFSASIVVSPPNRVALASQKGEKVSKPLPSEGGSSLNIMMRRVHVYSSTSSQPFEVIIAPHRQKRASDGGSPVIAAIRAEARGSVHIT